MGITHYFISMFEANHILPYKLKMTDSTIARKISREFPNRKSAQDFVSKTPNKTVNSYRYRYNKGKLTRNIPPKLLSLRYNKVGLVVNFKTGTIVLSKNEIQHLKDIHETFRLKQLESLI